jgi:Na+/H+-dicarboxylate symporter
MRSRKPIVALASAGLLWCIATGLLLWFLPVGSSSSTSSDGAVQNGGQSFSSVSGLGPLPLIVPVVVVAIATWSAIRDHRRVLLGATILLTLYSLLTGLSIGLFYMPAVAAFVVATVLAFSLPDKPPGVGADPGRDL